MIALTYNCRYNIRFAIFCYSSRIMIKYDQSLLGMVVKIREVVEAGDVTVTVDVEVAGDSVAGVE